jgi:hypothetical protein
MPKQLAEAQNNAKYNKVSALFFFLKYLINVPCSNITWKLLKIEELVQKQCMLQQT